MREMSLFTSDHEMSLFISGNETTCCWVPHQCTCTCMCKSENFWSLWIGTCVRTQRVIFVLSRNHGNKFLWQNVFFSNDFEIKNTMYIKKSNVQIGNVHVLYHKIKILRIIYYNQRHSEILSIWIVFLHTSSTFLVVSFLINCPNILKGQFTQRRVNPISPYAYPQIFVQKGLWPIWYQRRFIIHHIMIDMNKE